MRTRHRNRQVDVPDVPCHAMKAQYTDKNHL
jgi:hypothetical protein